MFLKQIEISYRKKLLSILLIWGILHKKTRKNEQKTTTE